MNDKTSAILKEMLSNPEIMAMVRRLASEALAQSLLGTESAEHYFARHLTDVAARMRIDEQTCDERIQAIKAQFGMDDD